MCVVQAGVSGHVMVRHIFVRSINEVVRECWNEGTNVRRVRFREKWIKHCL